MQTIPNDTTRQASYEPGSLRLMPGRRELALIVAFWGGFALLSVANRISDRGAGQPGSITAHALIAGAESLCWAVATPFLFWLVARIDLEDRAATRERVMGFLVLAAVTTVVVLLLGALGAMLRIHFAPLPALALPRSDGLPVPRNPSVWVGFLNALLLALGVLASGVTRAYSLRLRSRREQAIALTAQLADARLDALRRQLDPHFLFNTLNAITSLVEGDPRGVRRMIARLGDLLRHSFESGHEAEVTVRRELALLGLYVDILQVRYGDRLTVAICIEDGILEALVPSLVLQPLVENAIVHGVERRENGGTVLVEGLRSGGSLLLRVVDDGVPDDFAELGHTVGSGGVGLQNTKERLQQLYGSKHRFTLSRESTGRVIAELELPFHLAPQVVHDD